MKVRFNSEINQSNLLTASQLKGRGADREQIQKTISTWKAVENHPEASKHQVKRSREEQHRLHNLIKHTTKAPVKLSRLPKPFIKDITAEVNAELRTFAMLKGKSVFSATASTAMLTHLVAGRIFGFKY